MSSIIQTDNLQRKNALILNLLNYIGINLDKNFTKLEKFNFNTDCDILSKLYTNFISRFEKNIIRQKKKLALQLIFIIIIKLNDINENYENFINNIMQVIFLGNNLKNRDELVNKLIKLIKNDIKQCFTKDIYDFIYKYNKKLGMNLISLFNILIYFFKDNS